jgi:hypothetical protein
MTEPEAEKTPREIREAREATATLKLTLAFHDAIKNGRRPITLTVQRRRNPSLTGFKGRGR